MITLRVCVGEEIEHDCQRSKRVRCEGVACSRHSKLAVFTVKEQRLDVNEEFAEKGYVLAKQLKRESLSLDTLAKGRQRSRTFSLAPSTSQMICAPR